MNSSLDLGKEFAFGKFGTLADLINALTIPLFMAASLGVLFYVIYAAYKWLISGGNKEELTKARQMIVNALVGIILLLTVWLFMRYLPGALGLTDFSIIR